MKGQRESWAAENAGDAEHELKISCRLEGYLFPVNIWMRVQRCSDDSAIAGTIQQGYKLLTLEAAPHHFHPNGSHQAKQPRQTEGAGPGNTQHGQRFGIVAKQEGRVTTRAPPERLFTE